MSTQAGERRDPGHTQNGGADATGLDRLLAEIQWLQQQPEQPDTPASSPLLDVIPSPVFVHDREFRIILVNRAYAARAGLAPEQLAGRRYWEVYPRLNGPLPGCAHATESCAPQTDELVHCPDGERLRSHSRLLTDARGRYLASIHLLEDVTALCLADSRNQLLGQALHQAASPIVLTNAQGRITEVNDAFRALYGGTAAELLGADGPPVTAREDTSEPAPIPCVRDHGTWHGEARLSDAGGNPIPVHVSLAPLRSPSGDFQGTIASYTDLRPVQDATRRLATLLEVVQELSVETDLERLGPCAVRAAVALLNADVGAVTQLTPPAGEHRLRWTVGVPGPLQEKAAALVLPSDSLAARVLRTGRTEVVDDYSAYGRSLPELNELGVKAVVIVPVSCNGTVYATLGVGTVRRRHRFDPEDVAVLEAVARQIGVALQRHAAIEGLHQQTWALQERVKELKGLYAVSHALADPDRPLAAALQDIADALPPAYQFPDIAGARIVVDDEEYVSAGFASGPWRQTRDLVTCGRHRGRLEVHYTQERPAAWEGPFLEEERELLNAVSERVGKALLRQDATRRLAESEARFRRVAETVPDVLYTADATHLAPTYISPALEGVLGFQPEEWLADPDLYMRQVHEEDRASVQHAVQQAYDQCDDMFALEYRIWHRDGQQLRWVSDRCAIERDANGRPLRLHGVMTDITDRVEKTARLHRINRALATLSSVAARVNSDEDEPRLLRSVCEILVNEGGYNLAWVGYARGGAVEPMAAAGKSIDYMQGLRVTVDDSPWGSGPAGKAIKTARPHVCRDIDADSCFAPWRERALKHGLCACIALPLITDDGIMGVLCIYSAEQGTFDSHERRLLTELAAHLTYGVAGRRAQHARAIAEAALSDSKQELQRIVESAADGMLVVDHEGMVRFANPATTAMLGRERESLIQQPFGMPVENGGAADIDVLRPDKTRRTVELRATGTEWDGQPAHLVSLHDVTERLQLEVERQEHADRFQKALVETIRAVALTIEKRDPYTAGHQQRVADLAVALAQALGMEPERIEGIRLGALIHDIGKIYVPAEILNRPGRLTEAEFNLIKSHAQIGYDIVKDIPFPWPVAEMVKQHHERPDGSGYPDGLEGEQIILEARVIAVADVVEAISSHRPYRPSLGVGPALDELEKNKGRLYDTPIVDACVDLFRSGQFSFEGMETG